MTGVTHRTYPHPPGEPLLVSGLIITLADDPAHRDQALASLRAHGAFMLGSASGRWLPAVMEAADDRECRALHDWIMTHPGVRFVDVVSVDFDAFAEPAALKS